MSDKRVLAVAAHPDDIEFLMAGTMLQLAEVGYELHYLNLANGCCGSMTLSADETAKVRRQEAAEAASRMPAKFHDSICDDLEIFYDAPTLKKVSSIVRDVAPGIVLTHALFDYMEDHMTAARLAVTASFAIGMPNFKCIPPRPHQAQAVALYHAQPYPNRDPFGGKPLPAMFVDVSPVLQRKQELLACHKSQKEWLDTSQGLDSYLNTSREIDQELGSWSQRFEFAEGWTQHAPTGFGPENWNPIADALKDSVEIARSRT